MFMCKFTQNQYISFAILFFILFFRTSLCLAEFTVDDEKKLGKEFYDKLAEHQLIFENKPLNDYINKIGNLVLKQTQKAPFNF